MTPFLRAVHQPRSFPYNPFADNGGYVFQSGISIWSNVAHGSDMSCAGPNSAAIGNGTFEYAQTCPSTRPARNRSVLNDQLDQGTAVHQSVPSRTSALRQTTTTSTMRGSRNGPAGRRHHRRQPGDQSLLPRRRGPVSRVLTPSPRRPTCSSPDQPEHRRCPVRICSGPEQGYRWQRSHIPAGFRPWRQHLVMGVVNQQRRSRCRDLHGLCSRPAQGTDNLVNVAYGTVSIILKAPFVSATASQSTVAAGDPLYITGTAQGQPSTGVNIWILGTNYAYVGSQSVNSDSSFWYEVMPATTSTLATGQYLRCRPAPDGERPVRCLGSPVSAEHRLYRVIPRCDLLRLHRQPECSGYVPNSQFHRRSAESSELYTGLRTHRHRCPAGIQRGSGIDYSNQQPERRRYLHQAPVPRSRRRSSRSPRLATTMSVTSSPSPERRTSP